jgi:membrane-bound metal-dependent hydrolase YbcI (DUF457 family)
MTGTGHRLTGIGAAFIAAAFARQMGLDIMGQTVAAGLAAVNTTIPDWIEIPIYIQGKRVSSVIPHRTITHWPPLWIALIYFSAQQGGLIAAAGLGISIGAFTHILGDAPNPMGIPWILPHKRMSLGGKGWWRSGQNELLMVTGYTAIGYGLWTIL